MNVELKLRHYRPRDLDAMYRLDMECFEPAFRFSRATMREFAEAPEAVTLIAETEGALVAFAIGEVAEGVAYIVTLDVRSQWRGRGFGRALIKRLEEESASRGAGTILLHVYVQNRPAVALYERNGYQRTGLSPDFYGAGLDALTYEKRL